MAMPSFLGSVATAAAEGQRVERCHYCGNWTWIDRDHAGLVICGRKSCEMREQAAQ